MEWAMSVFVVVATVTVAGLRWWSGYEADKADHAAGAGVSNPVHRPRF